MKNNELPESPVVPFLKMSLLVIGISLLLLADRHAQAEEAEKDKPSHLVRFCAMGDTPYTPEEYVTLPKQIAGMPTDIEFVIHVGDIKGGAAPCDESVYIDVAAILRKSEKPLFIIPGDNEWNDCTDPDQGWNYWVKHFLKFDQRWNHSIKVAHEPKHEDNFAFMRKDVLFVGINLVGGRVHDANEWETRQVRNIKWINKQLELHKTKVNALVVFGHAKLNPHHATFKTGFEQLATDFDKPVLYLQGDGHTWIKDYPFKSKNILRVQVDQGAKGPPVLVQVDSSSDEVFQFDRRK
ncbi:MAG: hypothetical protein COA78_25920 [Blastopirellula sp.]|nr:MAG: hypothetical protein COA78_25920 [Blastopirellula sp.]